MRELRYKALILLLAIFFIGFNPSIVSALSAEQKRLYQSGIYQYEIDPGQGANCGVDSTLSGSENGEKIWNFFSGQGLKPIAVAGIMGNFEQESGFDPAVKQGYTIKAIPDGGDGKTGYGIAQWTSQPRQANILAEIKNAGLQKYYGDGWGHPEVNKDIPSADTDKLLSIELNYAWSGDTTKIKDIASQLNSATSVKGNDGSTVLFHKLYERSADNAEQIKERVDSAVRILQKYSGGGVTSTGSCSTGELGGVSNINDALAWAQKFIDDTDAKYDSPLATARSLGNVYSQNDTVITIAEFPDSSSFVCWGAYGCDECTTLSGWFVTAMTDYTYGGGNGGDVVSNLAAKGVSTGNEPRPFSVFSTNSVGGQYGHTGVVLGVLGNGEVIALENNNGANTLKAYRYNIKEKYPDVQFAYVGDKLKLKGIPTAQ